MSAMARREAAGLVRRGQAGLGKAQQRLGEERVVIGRAVADLHRLPHRLGDALPGRVDQRARRRARDEHPRQVEQQRRVLVAARIQAGQRHQHFAAAQIRVADQVEGGIGRNEAVAAERFEQMRAAVADHALDLRRVPARASARARPAAGDAKARWYPAGPRPARRSRPSPARRGRAPASAPRAGGAASARRAIRKARSAATAAAAPDCPARYDRTCRDAGRRRRISAAGDRTHRTATGHPSGPSTSGRRLRRCCEMS